jgi:hypothetical protein
VKQLTLRGFDKNLERRLREVARTRRLSLNQAALALLREGAGLTESRGRANTVGDSLDHLIGTWSAEDERELLSAIGELEAIDPSLWR